MLKATEKYPKRNHGQTRLGKCTVVEGKADEKHSGSKVYSGHAREQFKYGVRTMHACLQGGKEQEVIYNAPAYKHV